MRRLQKSKRVSWASDVNLCQVRLFLSEESPSLVGQGVQDHLQAKASWLSHPAGTSADDILPPGFEGGNPANHLHIKLSDIPAINWRCPPRFVLSSTWLVVAAEESKEVEIQNQREMRVLEAVFPHASAIPPNPSFSLDVEDARHNDQPIPLIPLTPIEDEDASDVPPDSMGTSNVPMSSQSQPVIASQGMIHNISNIPASEKSATGSVGVEPDVVAAASVAFAALKSNEQGSLIDPDLLIKILNNPKLIEKLVQDCGAASNVPNVPKPPRPVPAPDPSYMQMRTDIKTQSSFTATSNGPFYGQPNGGGPMYGPNTQHHPPQSVPVSSATSGGIPQMKDMNYYKNLIQQHGGERQEGPPHQYNSSRYSHQQNQELMNPKPRESKPKIMKPCIYYNSSRGCRNGANCAYQHDTTSQQRSSSISEVQSAKRMKMDRDREVSS
ncbi:zinc finger CCCH domain-containing protein 6 [Euphorbia lathyris]|uniref:zinc finger CCCH domain-containing protein 6 n=1 Tax=Euphorbia lathyris TaxID=212925 RepID=UPI0033141893